MWRSSQRQDEQRRARLLIDLQEPRVLAAGHEGRTKETGCEEGKMSLENRAQNCSNRFNKVSKQLHDFMPCRRHSWLIKQITHQQTFFDSKLHQEKKKSLDFWYFTLWVYNLHVSCQPFLPCTLAFALKRAWQLNSLGFCCGVLLLLLFLMHGKFQNKSNLLRSILRPNACGRQT